MKRAELLWQQRLLRWVGTFGCLLLLALLLCCVRELPAFGAAGSPVHNEVSARYLEKGLEETGASNLVTGLILDYRAFDTFGETSVLFLSFIALLILLRRNEQTKKREARFQANGSDILRGSSKLILPFLALFGIYVVLCGHLSPGGGFSGGIILGAGAILCLTAFASAKVRERLTYRGMFGLSLLGMLTYSLCKLYVFYCGGNQLPSHIPLGQAGAMLSGGLIPLLNICVGVVVGTALYGFYALFLYDDV